jgi:uncharacterized protein YegP (UPF0339 family)
MWIIQMEKNRNGKWFHRLKSENNGRIVYHSEAYSSKQGAMKTINRLLSTLKYSKLEVL